MDIFEWVERSVVRRYQQQVPASKAHSDTVPSIHKYTGIIQLQMHCKIKQI